MIILLHFVIFVFFFSFKEANVLYYIYFIIWKENSIWNNGNRRPKRKFKKNRTRTSLIKLSERCGLYIVSGTVNKFMLIHDDSKLCKQDVCKCWHCMQWWVSRAHVCRKLGFHTCELEDKRMLFWAILRIILKCIAILLFLLLLSFSFLWLISLLCNFFVCVSKTFFRKFHPVTI